MRRRVVITGMGAITPLGNDLKTTWQAVINGSSGIGLITRFDASTFPVKIAGEVRDFQFDCSLLPRDCSGLVGRSAQLGIAAARMALEDAGLALPAVEQPVMGISLGADEEYIPLRLIPSFFNRDYVYRAYVDPVRCSCAGTAGISCCGKAFFLPQTGRPGHGSYRRSL